MKRLFCILTLVALLMSCCIALAGEDVPRPAQTFTIMSVCPVGVYETMGNGAMIDWFVRGDQVQVDWICNGWARVCYDTRYGYIRSEYLYKESCHCGCFVVFDDPQTYEVLSKNWLNVRQRATKDSPAIGRLYKGDLIQVIATDCNWSAVIWKGELAFVMTKFIKPYSCCTMCDW